MLFDDGGVLDRKGDSPQPSGKIPEWLDIPDPKGFRPKRKYRTVWISDVHLGTRGCNAAMLVDFLRSVDCQTLYLVGDIVDGWRLRKGWYWPDAHNEVVRRVLKMAHRGTRVVFIAGNHDEMLRDYAGMSFGGVEVALEAVHETADGRKLLITHGDSFDGVVLYAKWLAFLGDQAYSILLRTNIWFNAIRRRLRLRTWRITHASLAAVIVGCSVVHGMLIEGTMETMSKAALCTLVIAATFKVLVDLWARKKRAAKQLTELP